MAKTGRIYTYDSSQNVTFPAGVSAASFTEGGTSLAAKYLGKNAKAADADKLDGNDSAYYLNYNNLTNKPTLGTAASKNTGVSSGNIPILDSNGKLADSVIPAVAITDTYVVATEDAMLALSAQKGDVAIRSDLNKSFVLQATPASTLANWKELLTPTDAVLSVNGKTGAVTLNLDNIDDGSTRKLTNYVPKSLTSAKGDMIYASAANTPARLEIGSNGQFLSVDNGAPKWVSSTDETITLATNLYAYANIGKITGASNTSPKLVANKGDTLKTVFNKVFGTQQDEQPSINTNGVSLSTAQTKVSAGGDEYGTSVSAMSADITFTLNNSATAKYGYRCGNTKTTTSNATFKYAITKQNNADIKITLPSGKTAAANMVTVGTYISHSNNILYCNFNNNQVQIHISADAGNTTTNNQTRYGVITGSVTLGDAQTSNGTKIDKFLTYLENDATTTDYYSGGTKSATTTSYTISAGYVPYCYALASSVPSSLPASGRSKNKPTSITVSGGNSSTYLYIFVPSDKSDITSLSASGFDVPFSKVESNKSLVVNNNKSANYKVFKTNNSVKADTFKIA